jgi:hypothetical protein
LTAKVAASKELDPQTVEGYSVTPRLLVEGIIKDLLANPVAFLGAAFGEAAGPK